MTNLSPEGLEKIQTQLDAAIKRQRETNLSTLQMVERLIEGPQGWTDERKVKTLSILLAVAIQRLVMHEVMNDDGPGELDWPEGFLPGEA